MESRHSGTYTRWTEDTMEHRTLLSLLQYRHGGLKPRWNMDTVQDSADPVRRDSSTGELTCLLEQYRRVV